VLLVPSLINRHYVLDLHARKSFAEWLVARGHDVFIIDWGTPGRRRPLPHLRGHHRPLHRPRERVACRHPGATRPTCSATASAARSPSIHAAVRPEHIASLTLLAAPVGFHDEGLLSRWTRSRGFDVRALVDATGQRALAAHAVRLPPAAPHAERSRRRCHMLDRAWDDEFLDGFLALETWGNDNVSFPGACYRDIHRGALSR
jgi:polyhydroxyalkanoate synthase